MLAGLLMLGGLAVGGLTTTFQGLELLALALIAADAWSIRRRIPILSSSDKALAAGGWALLMLVAVGLALAMPVL